MTTPEDAKDLFAVAQAAFTPGGGAPNNDDVKRLNELFVSALQSIDAPGGVVDLSDILLSDDDHKVKQGGDKTLKYMEAPIDNSIVVNANNGV